MTSMVLAWCNTRVPNTKCECTLKLLLRAHKARPGYSFALVCYEILTRKQPFEGEKMGDLRQQIKVDCLRPELPERCPTRLASLIQRCWEQNLHERLDFPEICRELRYIKGLLLTGIMLAFLSPQALP